MNTIQIAEQVKSVIMKELFTDVDNKRCTLDLLIENEDRNIEHLSKVSQLFWEGKKSELINEYNNGDILFFRKYNYEKILIEYLECKYRVNDIEFDLFPSDKKIRELEEKHKHELRETQQEIKLIKQIPHMKWEKTVRVSCNVYSATYENGKKIELYYGKGKIGKHNKIANKLTYDSQPLKYAKYDVKSIVEIIERTHPQNVKADNIMIATNKNMRKKEKKQSHSISIKCNIKKENVSLDEQFYTRIIQKLSNDYKVDINTVNTIIRQIQKKCSYCRKENCTYFNKICNPYQKQCINYYRFISKILEVSKEQNRMKREPVKQKNGNCKVENNKRSKIKHELGLKDFVVRVNVFKCMHSKHKIENVVAMINIDDNGKKMPIKISAGYCSQCKIYFIMDSTYENLRKRE